MYVCMTSLPSTIGREDDKGERKYVELKKPLLPNHKSFNPQKENQRGNYFYSLILLLVHFMDEVAKWPRQHFIRQKILEAQEIEARFADGEPKVHKTIR